MPRKHQPRRRGRRSSPLFISQKRVDALRPEMNLAQVARILNVSWTTVRRWLDMGLEAYEAPSLALNPVNKHYKVTSEDLIDFLRETGRYRQAGY